MIKLINFFDLEKKFKLTTKRRRIKFYFNRWIFNRKGLRIKENFRNKKKGGFKKKFYFR
jgi:hypothetical protein